MAKNQTHIVRVPVNVKGYSHQHTLSGYELDGSIDKAIDALEQLKLDYPDKNLFLSWEQEKYEDFHSLHLYEERPENEKERKEREMMQVAHEKQVRKQETELLKRLKEKYPDL